MHNIFQGKRISRFLRASTHPENRLQTGALIAFKSGGRCCSLATCRCAFTGIIYRFAHVSRDSISSLLIAGSREIAPTTQRRSMHRSKERRSRLFQNATIRRMISQRPLSDVSRWARAVYEVIRGRRARFDEAGSRFINPCSFPRLVLRCKWLLMRL